MSDHTEDTGDRRSLAIQALVALVLLAAVAPFVVYAVPQLAGADHGLVVLSGSMEPAISTGDAVIVREVSASEIENRDVITFQRPGSETPTTHRVVEIRQTGEGETYVTKGDANEEADVGTVPYDRVVGKVIFVIPFIGYFIQFANTQLGFFALVLTPMVLFVVSELWEMAKSVGSEGDAATGTEGGADGTPERQPPSPAAVQQSASADSGDTDEGFTLTRSSLQLLIGLLGLYIPYSSYVAYTLREAWAIGAATATIVGFLFCLVIYVASFGSGEDRSDGGDVRTVQDLVRPGPIPERLGDRTTIPLDSVEPLVQLAADRDDWVLYDDTRDTYHLAGEDALYLHRATPETDGGTAAGHDPASADQETTGADEGATGGSRT